MLMDKPWLYAEDHFWSECRKGSEMEINLKEWSWYKQKCKGLWSDKIKEGRVEYDQSLKMLQKVIKKVIEVGTEGWRGTRQIHKTQS